MSISFEIIKKRVCYLTKDEYKSVSSLNFREQGLMLESLRDARYFYAYRNSYAILIKNNNVLLGWSLLYKHKDWKRYKAYFYIRKTERGKGFGKILINHIDSFSGGLYRVYPHCEKSLLFFTKNVPRNKISKKLMRPEIKKIFENVK